MTLSSEKGSWTYRDQMTLTAVTRGSEECTDPAQMVLAETNVDLKALILAMRGP